MKKHLAEYFSTTWLEGGRDLSKYKYSGYALMKKVHFSESVLDVGCGTNPFKRCIGNLHGIDITDVGADEVIAIEDFETAYKYDVAFCLGSINFGDENTIRNQIRSVDKCLRDDGRIYWRCNPGLSDHGNEKCKELDVFPWSFDYHEMFAAEHGYIVKDLQWDSNERIYAEWVKSPNVNIYP